MTIIKKMHLRGFKSFAKPTDLVFGNNFNCILGPNGSGKSNVMDALCFVLGKSSAKSMRAEKSSHLIFNGGKKGSPMKEAEVSIFFDNAQKEFPVQTSEIKISRIVRASGQSIYRINDETKTRQEVIDLLSAAKIDPDGHNIVLQGDIVGFTEMRPIERRELIEEIAGISIYEDKKEKALSELEKVEGKLAEASIILTERQTHLRELKKERDQALKFKELETRIKENKATYLNFQIKEKNTKKEEIESRLKNNESTLNKIQEKIDNLKKEINERKEKIQQITNEIEEKGEKGQVEVREDISDLKTSVVRLTSRLETCKNEVNKINERKEQLKKNLEDINETITELQKSKKDLEEEKKKLLSKEGNIKDEIQKFKEKHGIKDIDDFSSKIEELEKRIEEKQKELSNLQEQKQEIVRKKDQSDFKLQHIEEKIKNISELEKNNNVKRLRQDFKKTSVDLNKALNENTAISAQLSKARESLTRNSGELSKLNIRHIGIKEGIAADLSIKRILALKKPGIHGTVSDLGKVDSKYALALEIAAGPRIKSIVVESDKVAVDCIRFLKENRLGVATFLPLNKIKPRVNQPELKRIPGVHGSALDLITFSQKFKNIFSYVFGNTLVIENVETARKIGVGRARMVTLDGDLFEPSGAIIGGFRKRKAGIGFQEKDMDINISNLEKEVSRLKNIIVVLEKTKLENEEKIDDLRENKAQIEGETIKIEKSVNIEGQDLDTLKNNKSQLKENISEITKELRETEEKIKKQYKEIDNLNIQKQEFKKQMSNFSPKISTGLNSLEEDKQKIREHIIEINSEIKNFDIQITDMQLPEKEKTIQIIKQQEKEVESFKEEINQLDSKIKEEKESLLQKEAVEQRFYKEYKESISLRSKLSEEIQKREMTVNSEEAKTKEIQNRINSISITRAKVVAELEALQKEFEPFIGTKIRKGVSIEELKSEISKFERAKNDMGSINLRALEIYESIEKEYQGLLSRVDKLRLEKEDVLKMMHEIDNKKTALFMETFKVLANNFNRIFSSLSTKGEAYLQLENPEEPLTAGLNIRVKLIENKFLDIRSLSGGEKTLTALAFIFAIQEYQPASFYLLDEVDAALDKRNSELLSKLTAKYAQRAQYIFVSHNDAVISEADQIYGISMQQNGISKVVSLKI